MDVMSRGCDASIPLKPGSLSNVVPLILRRLECSAEVIVDDYMKSKDNLMDMLTAYVQIHPEVDLEIIVPHRETMERLLKEV